MPELPEVETIRRVLSAHLTGRRILGIQVRNKTLLRGQSLRIFRSGLLRQKILGIERRAKYLLFRLQQGVGLIHLGMSGQILLQNQNQSRRPNPGCLPDKHSHLIVELSGGWRMIYRDPRRFGRVQLLTAKDAQQLHDRLGPEPLDPEFRWPKLSAALQGRRTTIKAFLLNQQHLAGIGNIYADESLFRAGIYPGRTACRLTSAEVKRLHQAIRQVLRMALRYRGTSISDYCDPQSQPGEFQNRLWVYGREGEACRICGHPIRKTWLAQRGTHWCPRCQK